MLYLEFFDIWTPIRNCFESPEVVEVEKKIEMK